MKTVVQILVLLALTGCAAQRDNPPSPQSSAVAPASPSHTSTPLNPATADLTFLGTVTSIDIADTGNRLKNWVVTTRVDNIISGDFSGTDFSFTVHSPARSGLEVGKQYRITAARTQQGYSVDQYQWMKAP